MVCISHPDAVERAATFKFSQLVLDKLFIIRAKSADAADSKTHLASKSTNLARPETHGYGRYLAGRSALANSITYRERFFEVFGQTGECPLGGTFADSSRRYYLSPGATVAPEIGNLGRAYKHARTSEALSFGPSLDYSLILLAKKERML